MVIVNLSKTKMDHKADLIINAKCDEVMELVMEHLAIKVPVFDQPTVNEKSIHGPIQMSKYARKRRGKIDKDEKCKLPKTWLIFHLFFLLRYFKRYLLFTAQ